ncbi:MAG: DUF3365 domain-containing protein [Oceanicoccus sp.]
MKRNPPICSLISMLAAMLISLPAQSEEHIDNTALQAEAIDIVRQFGGTLKPLLKEAIATGGLNHAVDICSTQAPQIARQLSKESDWSVKRVSLKPRNTLGATADSFERKVLQEFDQRQLAGELPEKMIYAETTATQFRFMKAQGVDGLCLNCHGEVISGDVKNALQRYYPDDVATGYSLGQVRGAFSLTKTLTNDRPSQQ